MQRRESKLIHEVSTPLNMPVDSLDLPALRRVFADLFDRANEGILASKLDADDVILDRSVMLRAADGTTFSAPVEWLSDAERLKTQLRAATVTVRAWSGSDTFAPRHKGTEARRHEGIRAWSRSDTVFRAAPVRKRVQDDCRMEQSDRGLAIVAATVQAVAGHSP